MSPAVRWRVLVSKFLGRYHKETTCMAWRGTAGRCSDPPPHDQKAHVLPRSRGGAGPASRRVASGWGLWPQPGCPVSSHGQANVSQPLGPKPASFRCSEIPSRANLRRGSASLLLLLELALPGTAHVCQAPLVVCASRKPRPACWVRSRSECSGQCFGDTFRQ